ncbi:MAG: hypothetical protein PW735_12215 [Acidobacteriaceae bacterium]|nr:hypothetical protein [Acidobacteriaceae bacterium]
MKPFLVYLVRITVCWTVLLSLLRTQYPKASYEEAGFPHQYAITAACLTGFAIVGWVLRSDQSKGIGMATSAFIAFLFSMGVCYAIHAAGLVTGTPWEQFYREDTALGFLVLAPLVVSFLSSVLSLLPDRVTKDFEA